MKKRKSRSSDKNIKWIIVLLLVVVAGLVGLVVPQIYQSESVIDESEIECFVNSDCAIVSAEHCPCNLGGAPKCIAKINLGEYTQSVQNCPSIQGYERNDCGQISCGCVNNRCVGVPR